MAKEDSTEQTETPGGGRKLPIAIAITVGVLVGGGGGALLVGPLLASRISAPAAAQSETKGGDHEEEGAAGEEHAEEAEEESKGKSAPAVTHVVDNLVMNPAGSNGTRFLMLTAAFAVNSEEVKTEMTARDAEVRDAVLRALAHRSVDELADVMKRDSIKVAVRDSVGALFKKGSVKRVFLPQFVIQ